MEEGQPLIAVSRQVLSKLDKEGAPAKKVPTKVRGASSLDSSLIIMNKNETLNYVVGVS